MGNMHLVTGCAGTEHITAADQGAFNAALIGTGQFVLDKGNGLAAQVITNNQVRILDGELMMQGRFVRLDPDTYVDLTIDSGTQGYYRNDLIVARYTKDEVTGVEGCNLVVIKGTAVTGSPSDPAYTADDITNGASVLNDFPLWRLPISGINVGTPESMFGDRFIDSMRTLPEIRAAVNQIHEEVDKQLARQDEDIQEKIDGLVSYTKEETLSDENKARFGLGTAAVPDDVFSLLLTPETITNRFTEAEAQSVYLSLVGNVNTDMVSAALGKNNEDRVKGVGLALAMYMKYKDSTVSIEENFPQLMLCNGLSDILDSLTAQHEIANNTTLWDYLLANAYAKGVLFDVQVNAVAYTDYGTVEKTATMEITEGHLDGSVVGILTMNTTSKTDGYTSHTIKINNVTVTTDRYYSFRQILTKDVLARYNITDPGTYEVYCSAHCSNSSYWGQALVNLTAFKTKGE